MPKFLGKNRYRLVDLTTGQVVIVFQKYVRMSVLNSCRMACGEFQIEITSGPYRLDRFVRNSRMGKFCWSRQYSFELEIDC